MRNPRTSQTSTRTYQPTSTYQTPGHTAHNPYKEITMRTHKNQTRTHKTAQTVIAAAVILGLTVPPAQFAVGLFCPDIAVATETTLVAGKASRNAKASKSAKTTKASASTKVASTGKATEASSDGHSLLSNLATRIIKRFAEALHREIVVSVQDDGTGQFTVVNGSYDATTHAVKFEWCKEAEITAVVPEGTIVIASIDGYKVDITEKNTVKLTHDDEGKTLSFQYAHTAVEQAPAETPAPVAETPAPVEAAPAEQSYQASAYEEQSYDNGNYQEDYSGGYYDEPSYDGGGYYEEPAYEEPVYEEPAYSPAPVYGVAPHQMSADDLAYAHAIFDAYNNYRMANGLAPTTWDDACANMAYSSASQCAARVALVHRLGIPADLQHDYSDILQYTSWNESPEGLIQRWDASIGHKRQMLCPTAQRAAAAVARNEDGVPYFAIVYSFDGCNIAEWF